MTILGWWRRCRLLARQRRAEASAGLVTRVDFRVVRRGAAIVMVVDEGKVQHAYVIDDDVAYRLGRQLLKTSRKAESARRDHAGEGELHGPGRGSARMD